VSQARVLTSGALELDRRWALFDERDRPINGKNRAAIHEIRAQFDLARLEVVLGGHTFSLERQGSEIANWFSTRLSERVELRENRDVGFPDDTDSPGPTFVSEGSLARVAEWFALPSDEMRRRFRTNIECDAVDAFWEDRLYGAPFTIGPVCLDAINPCARCVVPSRHPDTGDVLVGFQRRFMEMREAQLPEIAQRGYFDHHYRFAVNTRIAPSEAGKTIREGDEVALRDHAP
jgi:uncharacterized protein YcbX